MHVLTLPAIDSTTHPTNWNDTNDKRIEAHGGCIIRRHEMYYWYGEDHHLGKGNKTGINCYRSKDLTNWEFLGLALPKSAVPPEFRDDGACERPKVLFCGATERFMMWVHLAADSHTEADAGVAVSLYPEGPFELVRRFRPIRYNYKGLPARQWAEEPLERLRRIDEFEKGGPFGTLHSFKTRTG